MGNALNIVLKTDVDGSVDAVQKLLGEIKTDEASVRVIHSAPGTVTESDVLLAAASEAIILSFNTRTEPGAKRLAEQDGIEIRNYSIIYRLAEDIEKALPIKSIIRFLASVNMDSQNHMQLALHY